MIAQSAAPQVAQAPTVRTRPVAVQVRASARVLRPTRISIDRGGEAEISQGRSGSFQRERDAAGTVWVEFN